MSTGERIKEARKKVGMTQAELASKLGISYVGVSQWENDLRNPKPDTLLRIAVALRMPVEQILGEPSWMSENLRFYRKIDGVSRNKLSEETGIEVSDIKAYENPSSGRFITKEHLEKIANYFHVPTDQILGYSTTQEWMLETMERNKKLQEDDPPVKNITFNATPDPEWAELERKMDDGTITPEEAQRYKELMDQANESFRKMIPKAKQRLLDMMERLSDSDLRVVTAMMEQMIAERPLATTLPAPNESEGKDTTPPLPPSEPPENGG